MAAASAPAEPGSTAASDDEEEGEEGGHSTSLDVPGCGGIRNSAALSAQRH